MKKVIACLGLLSLAGCYWMQSAPDRGPQGQPQPREERGGGGGNGNVDNRLVGTWTNSWRGDYGGYISRQITLHANGTYAYTSTSYFSSGGDDVDTRKDDNGSWACQGNTIRYRSSRTGQTSSFQFRMDGSGQALSVGDQVWTRQ